jgi:proton-dependent oligopeptide transporter, POT family
MALGISQHVVFRRNLGAHGCEAPNPLPHKRIALYAAVAVLALVASVTYLVVMLTSSKVQAVERTRVRAFIPLFIADAVFWSLFQQIFGSRPRRRAGAQRPGDRLRRVGRVVTCRKPNLSCT